MYETGSMTGILEQLRCESLKKKRRDSRLIMLSGADPGFLDRGFKLAEWVRFVQFDHYFS